MSQERIVQIERDILGKNDDLANINRARFAKARVFALNFVSSPGAGKTSLLVKTISDLKDRQPIAVIEGDQQTSNDAERIRATGVPAVQVNTGKGCHLDASMVGAAFDRLPPSTMGFCSSRMSATWSARRPSISVKPTRSWYSPPPRARTSR